MIFKNYLLDPEIFFEEEDIPYYFGMKKGYLIDQLPDDQYKYEFIKSIINKSTNFRNQKYSNKKCY